MKQSTLTHKFVEAIPEKLAEGTLYVAMDFATAIHKCCCGCGQEVVTPLSPTDWKLTYDGVSISLSPSIGNWSFKCQSHYWIVNNRIKWAGHWSPEQVQAGRANDQNSKQAYFGDTAGGKSSVHDQTNPGLWSKFWKWFSR
jgi:Family of unknown function (DUF6527)